MIDQSTQTISIQSLEIKPKVTFRREKTTDEAFFQRRKELPINVYFRSEDSRRKHNFQKQCKPWYYYVDSENTYLYGKPSSQFIKDTSSPSVHKNLQAYSDLFPQLASKDRKRVAFEDSKVCRSKEKLPIIPTVARSQSDLNKFGHVTDVTLQFKKPIKEEESMSLKDLDILGDNGEDIVDETEVYTISFRQDSKGDYDPQSEMHSDYYTLKKIETVRKRAKPQKMVTIPDHRKDFKAILLGSQKHLHKKFNIACEGFHSVPLLREWAQHQREMASRISIPCYPVPSNNKNDHCPTSRT